MAGSFGYEQGHYEVSQACGERVLFPQSAGPRPVTWSSPPASNCRHHIADFWDNSRSLDSAELLAMAGSQTLALST